MDEPARDINAGEHETPAEPHVAEAGERIVLNASQETGDRVGVRELAAALLGVAGDVSGEGRGAVAARVEAALVSTGQDAGGVQVDVITDKLLRAARSGLVVETDDGEVLGTFQGEAGTNERVQPHVSDPADEDRPFYS